MSPLEWVELRKAATLVHAVPGLAVQVRYRDDLVIDVAGSPGDDEVGPCQFRAAVARTWANRSPLDDALGGIETAAFDEGRLSIALGLPAGASVLPGGIYRVPLRSRRLFVLVTSASLDLVRDETALATQGMGEIEGVWGVGVRPDAGTDVRLVYCEVDVHARGGEDRVVELLQDLAARFAVGQLIEATSAGPKLGR